jgi:phenylalanyl-tRNA synthetase beta chain
MSGRYAPRHWSRPERQVDLYDIKGAAESLLTFLKVDDATFEAMPGGEILLNRLAVRHQGDVIGLVGQVEPGICSRFEVDLPLFVAELDWQRLSLKSAYAGSITFSPVSRYPTVVRDLAVVLGDEVPAHNVETTIRGSGGPLLRLVQVFDVYRGAGLEPGRKSLAVSMTFGADRTLVDEEVDDAVNAIVTALEHHLDAMLRS